MLAIIFASITLEIFTAYSLIKFLIFDNSISLINCLDFLIWTICLIIPQFVAIHASSSCSTEARKLNILIDKQMSTCDDSAVVQKVWIYFWRQVITRMFFQLTQFSSRIQLRAIVFNCIFFNIDWPITLTIFGTIATYMVIIFQYEKDTLI